MRAARRLCRLEERYHQRGLATLSRAEIALCLTTVQRWLRDGVDTIRPEEAARVMPLLTLVFGELE